MKRILAIATIKPVLIVLTIAGMQLLASSDGKKLNDLICEKNTANFKKLNLSKSAINKIYSLDKSKFSLLELANYCYGGAPDIADYLIERGANVNLSGGEDYNPLMWAIRSMNKVTDEDPFRRVVFRMIEKGANINHIAKITGRTPLMLAAGKGDFDLVKLMLKKGADKNVKANPGWDEGTAADYARQGGHVELALLIEGKDPAEYRKTLHYAVIHSDLASVKEHIQKGSNLNEAETISLYTPLHYSAQHNRIEATKLLLNAGANPNLLSHAGTTPLREAIVNYYTKLALTLVENGARGDNKQTKGCGSNMTEFGWAISYNGSEIAYRMLDLNRVDVNKVNVFSTLTGYHKTDLKHAQNFVSRGILPTEDDVAVLKGQNYAGHRLELIRYYESILRDKNLMKIPVIGTIQPKLMTKQEKESLKSSIKPNQARQVALDTVP
ncbi:MAG: ankyrin repeat domain-containing protein [Leptospiraceae bacterium]|nr:ankyrin repeat domain-containing protein [Leptospiraceae bacterium]